MKLKKLIPLAGIAGVAAIAAPLVSSCSNEATEFVWTAGDQVPTITPVQRKYKLKMDEESLSENVDVINKATKDYLEDLKADKTLFAKDIINSWASQPVNEESLFDEISITTNNVNTDDLTLSYKINIKATVSDKINARKNKVNVSVEVKNVRFIVIPKSILNKAGGTGVVPAAVLLSMIDKVMNDTNNSVKMKWLELLRQEVANVFVDDSWYIDLKVNFESTDTINTYHADRSNIGAVVQALMNDVDTPSLEAIVYMILGSVEIDSMYLSEVDWGLTSWN